MMPERQLFNRELVRMLADIVENNPDLRFHQLLIGFGFIEKGLDEFSVESWEILSRVKRRRLDIDLVSRI